MSEAVIQPKFAFTRYSAMCSNKCEYFDDGSILHRPPCRACRREYTDQDRSVKVIWIKEYPSVYGRVIPRCATRREQSAFAIALLNNAAWLPAHLRSPNLEPKPQIAPDPAKITGE